MPPDFLIDKWGFPIPDGKGGFVTKPKKPKNEVHRRFSGEHPEQLAALKKLQETAPYGATFTLEEIADAMQVDKETVRNIEQRALKKLRKLLGPDFLGILRESIKKHG